MPTGGGKTMCMIRDAIDTIDRLDISTIVVVAPRILLAEQLCSEFLEHIDVEDVKSSIPFILLSFAVRNGVLIFHEIEQLILFKEKFFVF